MKESEYNRKIAKDRRMILEKETIRDNKRKETMNDKD
jgi:hypothetical protein